nr:cationic amino acid transporter 2-like [Cherax quadricarinatus]
MSNFIYRLSRKKFVTFEDTELPRVLTALDLTFLGIGSTIGVGIYVLAGQVARETAGPAVIISFLIAAIASVFAGLCYAEFGARVPKAGSAYVYTYVCIGEFIAFIIGWNLILEYAIGTASVASGYSGYVDELANKSMSQALAKAMPIDVSFLSTYPDFLAFGLSFVLALALSLGVKSSSRMNNVFTSINLFVIVFVIIAAGTQASVENWAIPEIDLYENGTCTVPLPQSMDSWGVGGFAPYGFSGIMQGAATCFFGFVGFDCVATTGEEAINPQRNIPIAISLSLLFVFLSYFGISAVLTLAVPYCMEDPHAPLVDLFEQLGWIAAKWVVSIGALFGFSARFHKLSLIQYASKYVSCPLNPSNFVWHFFRYTDSGVCSGNSEYTLLRNMYADDDDIQSQSLSESRNHKTNYDSLGYSHRDYMKQLFNQRGLKDPTDLSSSLASYATVSYCFLALILALLLKLLENQLASVEWGAITGVVIVAILCIINVFILSRQPESKTKLSFKVPLVPWTPAISALFNLYLMCNLPVDTWIRFGIWMAIGFLVYFGYGLWNSSADVKQSGAGHGVNNLGFTRDGVNGKTSSTLIIPTIEIHLATPANSEPNTPKSLQKSKVKTPLAQSPLVTVQVEVKHYTESDVDGTDGERSLMRETQSVLTSLDKLFSASAKEERDRLQCETSKSYLEDNKDTLGELQDDTRETSSNNVQGRELPVLLWENNIRDCDEEKSSLQNIDNNGLENSGYGSSKQQLKENKSQLTESVDNDSNELGYVTLKDVKTQVAENVQEDFEDGRNDENDNKEKALALDNLDELHENREPLYATVIKKTKIEPLKLKFNFDDDVSILRSSQSAPILQPSTPPPPALPPKIFGYSHSSVPSTPVSKKHPFKVLKRNSSFDGIPPSSPDSPFARRLGNKFVIIPVKEPEADSDTDSINHMSFIESIVSDKQEPYTENTDEEDTLMNEATSKLENDSKLSSEIQKGNKEPKMFTIGSDDSLDSAIIITNSSDFINNFPSPTITSQTREFKKVFSKESLEVLDTIRERGESKILAGDEDKTDVKVPGKSVATNTVVQNELDENLPQNAV